ncbi:succinylglutamate desuccinylase/aspartoacylase family protein [Thermomonas brevis]|uniref:Succinylglutamate desuccinylase/aspartoacylase family protein n=2 Tax=Thermomonas brevis TaxID=215691 RepID=A0A7G9QTB4_9GAMM|nr:succinylglutamate desuccinylase/aspartoacylase family protein [Thermomonas brevis]
MNAFPIGTPGQPWGEAEKAHWRAMQAKKRSYADEVLARIDALRDAFDVAQYGELDCGADGRYPLFVLRSRDWDDALPVAVVTGGVHGYETSGVHGALQFAERHAADYAGRANALIAPCVSPWAYERIHRWNAQALDPNRNFRAGSPAAESAALWELLRSLGDHVLVHIDLHETTDSDETEFRPSLAARDGKPFEPGTIPDGFYLCADSARPEPAFQWAINAEVAKVTHIAPADPDGTIIGSPVVAPGVIEYDCRALGLCAGITDARFVTTTEVYPDSPRATPQQCNDAQAAAVCAALDFALARHVRRIDAGPRMSEAVIHGGIVHLAGQVPETAGADIETQTREVLAAIDALLAQAGSDKTRILRAQIYLADIAEFAGMNRAWDAWVVPGKAPARATVEAKLADPDWKVEIVVTAAL